MFGAFGGRLGAWAKLCQALVFVSERRQKHPEIYVMFGVSPEIHVGLSVVETRFWWVKGTQKGNPPFWTVPLEKDAPVLWEIETLA